MLVKWPMVNLSGFRFQQNPRSGVGMKFGDRYLGFLAEGCVELLTAAGFTIHSEINRRKKRDRKFLEPGLSKEGERHRGYKKHRESSLNSSASTSLHLEF